MFSLLSFNLYILGRTSSGKRIIIALSLASLSWILALSSKENAAVIPNTADSTPSGQGGTDTGSRLNLNEYVAPGTPKGGGNAGAPRDKRIWSTPEIGKFYSDVQKGRYKNRPEDKARIEADIVAATREGRIQS
jgi:hypothetical protein